MTRPLVLDAAAFDRLVEGDGSIHVRAALEAASRLGRDVIVPAVVLAELYRGHQRSHELDALLARERGISIRRTDRVLARLVGGLMSAAGVGTEHMVDAHVVAVAAEHGGGVCLTGDTDDLERLAAGSPAVIVGGI
jgi:predicted nucleic acid-binding protein